MGNAKIMISTNNDNYFLKLQEWYLKQCDGDWEHEFGIVIDTLDNPGWSLRIDLKGTLLEGKPFTKIKKDLAEDDWVHCWIAENQFQAGGGPSNLVDLIRIFIEWSSA
jgi:hypothetical protein